MPHIVIIGGGFCGTMMLVNLIHQTSYPIRITLLEKSAALAKGIAYGTIDPCHLLNVRACKMGALADDPDHFYKWLLSTNWRSLHPSFEKMPVDPNAFLPRMIYGAYLEHLLQASLSLASQKKITVSIINGEAWHIEAQGSALFIQLKGESPLCADAVVLALGVPQNKNFSTPLESYPSYISSIWPYMPQINLSKTSTVAIIGTGLTMVDAYITLLKQGFQGKVLAFSRSGMLPAVHSEHPIAYPKFIDLQNPPATALQLLKIVRQEFKSSSAKGIDWRGVVDALREIIEPIWVKLSWNERHKAMCHLLNHWNHFRHRMPNNYAGLIQKEQLQGRFDLVRGKVLSIACGRIEYRPLGASESKIVEADYVINCAGPDMNIRNYPPGLLQNLMANGFVISDPLRAGIQADAQGGVKGRGHGRLFALGQLLFGERLESTAVPDLRNQCANLAIYLLNFLCKFPYEMESRNSNG